jgi:hypothetical protein
LYKVYTVVKANDDTFRKQFYKEIEGDLKIPQGKPFGFLGDAFVHPSIVTRRNLTNGMHLKGNAIKSYNPVNKKLDWKLL